MPQQPRRPALTVREAVRLYLADRDAEGQDTQRSREQLDAHVLPRWGGHRVADLTAAELKAWRNALAVTGPRLRRSRHAAEPRFAPLDLADDEARRRRRSTVNRITTTFKAALNYAARMHPEECPNDGAWREGLSAFRRVDAARERWLDSAEVSRLIDACAPDFRRLVQAALYTGCRYGELGRAKVGDYDGGNRALRVPVSKSGKGRSVIVHEEGAAFLNALCAERPTDAWLLTHGDANRPWKRAEQIRPMARACRRAGIAPPVSFHCLRHTYASLAVQSGMALVALARNLGHADTRMVEKHYGHLSDRYLREQVQRFAPTFRNRRGSST